MSLIDQRILIVAPPEAIWAFAAEPTVLTKWHLGCKQVSVLSTRPTGVGARRRVMNPAGKASVEETTAWLDNIGYEYIVVDGPYKQYKARIRLQAIPEGTMVNWTVEYRLKGLLAGLRNLLSYQRKLEHEMADSLRQLKKLVEASGVQIDPQKHARAAMQPAPNVEQRAARRPITDHIPTGTAPVVSGGTPAPALRPIQVDDEDFPPVVTAAPAPALTVQTMQPVPPAPAVTVISVPPVSIPEPPVDSEEDTKPRPVAAITEPAKTPPPEVTVQSAATLDAARESADLGAPTVPISLVAPPRPPDPDTQTLEVPVIPPPSVSIPAPMPTPPPTIPERVPTNPPMVWGKTPETKLPSKPLEIVEPPPASLDDTQPTSPVSAAGVKPPQPTVPLPQPVPAVVQPTVTPQPTAASVPAEPEEVDDVLEMEKPRDPILPPPTGRRDTGEISIWDAFGVQRPSDKTKAELEAVIASITPPRGMPAVVLEVEGKLPRPAHRKAKVRVRTAIKRVTHRKAHPRVRRAR